MYIGIAYNFFIVVGGARQFHWTSVWLGVCFKITIQGGQNNCKA